ncbi:MAG: DUF1634 domain-containing protein [Ignavibacteria bacterium]|nr:DUF1634 domain-containing protein [Ignavibacteria bacterium]
MDDPTTSNVERWISMALRIGVWSSAALMIAGLLAVWVSGSASLPPSENLSPRALLRMLFSSSVDGVTLIFSGLVVLMLTPFLRVLTAAIGFLAERDLKFAFVSLAVLSMLLGELFFFLR